MVVFSGHSSVCLSQYGAAVSRHSKLFDQAKYILDMTLAKIQRVSLVDIKMALVRNAVSISWRSRTIDYSGNVDVPLFALPEQVRRGHVRQKEYILRPRSTRSRVKGHLRLELSFLPRGSRPQPGCDADDELNPTSEPLSAGQGGGLAPLASTDNLEEV